MLGTLGVHVDTPPAALLANDSAMRRLVTHKGFPKAVCLCRGLEPLD